MLILEEPFASSWKDKDPFKEVEQISGNILREVKTRRTLRFDFAGQSFYLKLHHGISYAEAIKNFLQFRLPVFGADREWRAINELMKVGVDTMTGVAYGEKGLNPIKKTSFIITKDLSPSISLEDYCKDWIRNPPPYAIKRMLIKRVAEMVRKMHLAGINHRDCYICHFLLALPFDGQESNLKLSLIDLHRAQFRKAVPIRWRNKDLVALYYSTTNIGLTFNDFCLFLRVYFQKPLKEIFMTEASLIIEAEKTAFKIRSRSIKKGYQKLSLGKLIGIGSERHCYENLDNPNTCLKISALSSSKQTRREIKYLYYLRHKGIFPSFFPKFYGEFQTDEVIGIEQEYLKSNEQIKSLSVEDYLKQCSDEQLNTLLEKLEKIKEGMLRHNIIVTAVRPCNVFVITDRKNGDIKQVYFTDGYGTPELIPIALYCPILGRQKIERHWEKLMAKIEYERSLHKAKVLQEEQTQNDG